MARKQLNKINKLKVDLEQSQPEAEDRKLIHSHIKKPTEKRKSFFSVGFILRAYKTAAFCTSSLFRFRKDGVYSHFRYRTVGHDKFIHLNV